MEIWDKYKLGIRAGKYKLEARTGKYKFGARGRGTSKEPGAGKYKYRILGKVFFFVAPVYLLAVVPFLI